MESLTAVTFFLKFLLKEIVFQFLQNCNLSERDGLHDVVHGFGGTTVEHAESTHSHRDNPNSELVNGSVDTPRSVQFIKQKSCVVLINTQTSGDGSNSGIMVSRSPLRG